MEAKLARDDLEVDVLPFGITTTDFPAATLYEAAAPGVGKLADRVEVLRRWRRCAGGAGRAAAAYAVRRPGEVRRGRWGGRAISRSRETRVLRSLCQRHPQTDMTAGRAPPCHRRCCQIMTGSSMLRLARLTAFGGRPAHPSSAAGATVKPALQFHAINTMTSLSPRRALHLNRQAQSPAPPSRTSSRSGSSPG